MLCASSGCGDRGSEWRGGRSPAETGHPPVQETGGQGQTQGTGEIPHTSPTGIHAWSTAGAICVYSLYEGVLKCRGFEPLYVYIARYTAHKCFSLTVLFSVAELFHFNESHQCEAKPYF